MTGTGDVQAIWVAVDRLTKPIKLPIILDDGSTIYGVVPSLWELASDALATGNELGEQVTVSRPERAPIDLELMEMRQTILEFTHRELVRFRVDIPADVPAQLRRLAATAITKEPDEADFWAYRFAQWARLIEHYLAPVNRARRLRASCPRCGVDRVRVETDMGTVLAHPIFVHMHRDKVIHYARCQNADCGYTWYRGEAFHMLEAELAAMPARHAGALVVAERTLETA